MVLLHTIEWLTENVIVKYKFPNAHLGRNVVRYFEIRIMGKVLRKEYSNQSVFIVKLGIILKIDRD